MNKRSTLIEEVRTILKNDNIKEYMDNHAGKIHHRLTPMIVGLYINEITYKQVNTWLYIMGESQINVRNPYEGMFFFIYERYPKYNENERVEKWLHLLNEAYQLIEDLMFHKKAEEINTFGKLCSIIEIDSIKTDTDSKTYGTKNYTQNVVYPQILKAINSNDDDVTAFSTYLEFLKKDESFYQSKGTYYLRKFLYEVVMSGIFLLYDRHQFAYRKEENLKTRRAAFSSDESFNTFISCNCLCLRDIKSPKPMGVGKEYKTLEEKCDKRKENRVARRNILDKTLRHIMKYDVKTDTICLTYQDCKEWLYGKKISYDSICSSFYALFGDFNKKPYEYILLSNAYREDTGEIDNLSYEEYNILRNAFIDEKPDMPILDEGEFFFSSTDTTDTSRFLLNKLLGYHEKDTRKKYISLLKDMVGGKINTSRRMLLLFGLFAECDEATLNHVMEQSGFEKLNKDHVFDKTILLLLKNDYLQNRKNLYNDEKFLLKITKIDAIIDQKGYEPFLSYVPQKIKLKGVDVDGSTIKKDYEAILNELKEDYTKDLYELFTYIENDTSLPTISDIFLNDRMKNILERQNKELAKINTKIKKM